MKNGLQYLDLTLLILAAALVIMQLIELLFVAGNFVADFQELLLNVIILLIMYKAYYSGKV